MAMYPALGVNDVGHASASTANRELVTIALDGCLQRCNFLLSIHHELNVVPSGEAEVAATMLISDITHITDIIDGNQTGRTATNGKHLGTCLGYVHQDTGLKNLVIEPCAFIFFNDGWQKIPVISRSQVGNPTYHRIFRIVTHYIISLKCNSVKSIWRR